MLVIVAGADFVDERGKAWRQFSAVGLALMAGVVFHYGLTGQPVLLVILLCTIPRGLALGSLPWLLSFEIFPIRLRGRAVSLTTAFLWLTIFAGAQLFPLMTAFSEEKLGSVGGVFWFFTVVYLFGFLFGWRMLPETMGKTLEEVAARWRAN